METEFTKEELLALWRYLNHRPVLSSDMDSIHLKIVSAFKDRAKLETESRDYGKRNRLPF